MEGQERGLRLPTRKGRIALLLILFDRNPCVLTRLEIGANDEKDRKFLNFARASRQNRERRRINRYQA